MDESITKSFGKKVKEQKAATTANTAAAVKAGTLPPPKRPSSGPANRETKI